MFLADMTLTKAFSIGPRYRLEARIEAYNAFNTIVWDNPDLNLSSAELRQGDAQAHRRHGPRDPDRTALRVLGAMQRARNGISDC